MLNLFWISGNTPSSKNGKNWTGTFLINSPLVTKWIKATKLEWEYQTELFREQLEGLPQPYYIEFTFYRNSRRAFDYHNIVQIVLDLMGSKHYPYKWIPDDNADVVKPYFGDYVYSKEKPGVLIRILKEKPKHY